MSTTIPEVSRRPLVRYTPTSAESICPKPLPFRQDRVRISTGEVTEQVYYRTCDQISCPGCETHVFKRMMGHFVREFERLPSVHAITLTLPCRTARSRIQEAKLLISTWGDFYNRLKYRCDRLRQPLYFWRVLGTDTDTRPHMHALISVPLPMRTVRDSWIKVGGGTSCFVDRMQDTDHLAGTVSYLLENYRDTCSGPPLKGVSKQYATHAIAYNGKKAKQRRRQFAVQQAEESREDGWDVSWHSGISYPKRQGSLRPLAEELILVGSSGDFIYRDRPGRLMTIGSEDDAAVLDSI
jgi:hypothetical protein